MQSLVSRAVPRIGLHFILGFLLSSCGGTAREDLLGEQGGSTLGGAGDGGSMSGWSGGPHSGGSAGTATAGGSGGASSAGAAGTTHAGGAGEGGSEAIDARPPDGNLIPEPSFESGHSGWTAFGPSTIVDVEGSAHTGLKCIAATNRAAPWQGPMFAVDSVVAGGTSYEASAWVRVTEGNVMTHLTLRTLCEGMTDSYTAVAGSLVGDEWTLLTGTFTAPTCTLDALDLFIEGPPAGVDIFVDDVELVAVQ